MSSSENRGLGSKTVNYKKEKEIKKKRTYS